MRRTRKRSPLTVAASVASMLALTGCGAQPEGTPTGAAQTSTSTVPSPTEPETAATPEQSGTAAATGIPDCFDLPPCEEQVDVAVVQADFGPEIAFIADTTDTWKPIGPAAQQALVEAEDATACLWGVPNSGQAVSIAVARTPDDGSSLIAALRDASATFSEETVGSARVFSAGELEDGDVTTAVTYVFDGPAWVAVGGGSIATADSTREVALAVHAGLAS